MYQGIEGKIEEERIIDDIEKTISGTLNLQLQISIDTRDNKLTVNGMTHQFIATQVPSIDMITTLSYTNEKYGLLTLGAKSSIGKMLVKGQPVNVQLLDIHSKPLQLKLHASIAGRIDGLLHAMTIAKLKEGDKIYVNYNPNINLLTVKKLKN